MAPALLNRLKDGLRTHGVILMLWPLIFKRLSVDAAVQLEISWHQVEVVGAPRVKLLSRRIHVIS